MKQTQTQKKNNRMKKNTQHTRSNSPTKSSNTNTEVVKQLSRKLSNSPTKSSNTNTNTKKITGRKKNPTVKSGSKRLANESKKKQKKGGVQYKTTLAHRNAVEKYDKSNTQSIRVKLNKKTDKVILKKLNSSGNKQGLIKQALKKI